jgi:hypothetical protein
MIIKKGDVFFKLFKSTVNFLGLFSVATTTFVTSFNTHAASAGCNISVSCPNGSNISCTASKFGATCTSNTIGSTIKVVCVDGNGSGKPSTNSNATAAVFCP